MWKVIFGTVLFLLSLVVLPAFITKLLLGSAIMAWGVWLFFEGLDEL